ncbi:UDP-glucuronosyltransferase 1A7-like [Panulirus ornatus]|uniref:UDP-glucuronosyltransferase 1A7-like n=1 Tax=Panulirus ornatus TaxID=150431 RepID=UPI003A8A08D5
MRGKQELVQEGVVVLVVAAIVMVANTTAHVAPNEEGGAGPVDQFIDNVPEAQTPEGPVPPEMSLKPPEGPEVEQSARDVPEIPDEDGDVVVISLGGGEEQVVMAQIATVLHSHGHQVTAIVYGTQPRDHPFPDTVKVREVTIADGDPLYPDGVVMGVTPGEEGGLEWVSGRVMASRARACGQVSRLAWVEETVARAKLLVAPLFLQDICVLTLARRAGVPAVGVLTSRVGAWWAWEHLGVLPPLATTPVPPTTMAEPTIWARASNLARHYGYLASLRQQWQVPALTALDSAWTPPTLETLYASLARVLLTWDPLLDAHIPSTPLIVPIGGFYLETGHITKDVLVPAILNRAGVLTVCPGGGEAWVGDHALRALYTVLESTSYTVLWRTTHPHLRPNVSEDDTTTAKFLFREFLPLSDVLNHPRHRILISTCVETEVMAAVYFGSPILCLPVTTDQTLAAAALVNLGLGVSVPAAEATQHNLREAIHTLATQRSYRERGRDLGEELHDQPLAPSDRLLFTLERVMRKPHSRRYRRQVSGVGGGLYLLQLSNADVYLLLLILLATLIGLLMALAIALLPILLKKQKAKAD